MSEVVRLHLLHSNRGKLGAGPKQPQVKESWSSGPVLAKLGLGNLPGDIRIERKGVFFYFPITSGLIVSLIVSLVLWLFRH